MRNMMMMRKPELAPTDLTTASAAKQRARAVTEGLHASVPTVYAYDGRYTLSWRRAPRPTRSSPSGAAAATREPKNALTP
jgi:hypothetical protein